MDHPSEWPWSSYLAMIYAKKRPDWLYTDQLLSQFSQDRSEAVEKYQRFVAAGINKGSIWEQLNRQIYLGDDEFIDRVLAVNGESEAALDVPKVQQRTTAPSLQKLASTHPNRNDAIVAAYSTGQYSYHQIARHFDLHYTSVGTIVRKSRNAAKG